MTTLSTPPGESAAQPDIENQVPSFSLLGKKAFVTGSSRGIGRSVALALASAGADVAISCNTGGASAEEVCKIIRDMGRQANYYAHNVGKAEEVEALCAEVKRDFGTIDILVNNAAINRDMVVQEVDQGGLGRGHQHRPDQRLPGHQAVHRRHGRAGLGSGHQHVEHVGRDRHLSARPTMPPPRRA